MFIRNSEPMQSGQNADPTCGGIEAFNSVADPAGLALAGLQQQVGAKLAVEHTLSLSMDRQGSDKYLFSYDYIMNKDIHLNIEIQKKHIEEAPYWHPT